MQAKRAAREHASVAVRKGDGMLETYGDLFAQEIQVFLAVTQTLLGGTQFACEEVFGFGDRVGEHHVSLVGEG